MSVDLAAAQQQQQRDGDGSEDIHQRRAQRLRQHDPQIGAKQPLGRRGKARILPPLHAEGLHNAVAGDGLVQNVLDIGQLVLPGAGPVTHLPADACPGKNDERNKQQQQPGEFPAQLGRHDSSKNQDEELLQEFRQHARYRVLHFFHVVDDGRDQRAGGMSLKKCYGTPQHRVVQVVAQVGQDSQAGVVHQKSAGVVEDPFQHGGCDQGKGHYRPRIMEAAGD